MLDKLRTRVARYVINNFIPRFTAIIGVHVAKSPAYSGAPTLRIFVLEDILQSFAIKLYHRSGLLQ
jgi:hypothetical protein